MSVTRLGIVGCAGRMGRMLIAAALERPECQIVGGTEAPGGAALGADLGVLAGAPPLGVTASDDTAALFAASDVMIDFSTPAVTVAGAALAAETGTGLVIGTTGLDPAQMRAVEAAAEVVPVLCAANMSLGVNLLLALVRQAAARLENDYDIEIVEMHHRYKVDAPSGTALALGEAAAAGRGVDLDAVAARGRDGQTGARPSGAIGFATLRGGDVPGDHVVIFAGDGERLELGHRASNRAVFAKGAVRAALWLAGRRPGLYGMADVLDLDG